MIGVARKTITLRFFTTITVKFKLVHEVEWGAENVSTCCSGQGACCS